MNPLSLGNHPAVDFLNTYREPTVAADLIGDGTALLEWTRMTEILDAEQAAHLARKLSASELNAAAAEARTFREWARHWLTRWRSSPSSDYSIEVAALNELLEKRIVRHAVVRTKQGLWLAARSTIDSGEDLLAMFATHIAELITHADPALLKSCAGNGCTLWFLDRTRAHRRLFCNATACGSRAKVATSLGSQQE